MQELQDADIIHRVLRGDQRAYTLLVDRYQHFVYTLTCRYIDNSEDAEEVAQDVFVKAYRSLASFDGRGKFSTWLYTITKNTCISRMRSIRPVQVVKNESQLAELSGNIDNVTMSQDSRAKRKLLANAISKLVEDEALIITLFYLHEQTVEEICRITDMSASNVKIKLFRARKRLKEILDRHYGNDVHGYTGGK